MPCEYRLSKRAEAGPCISPERKNYSGLRKGWNLDRVIPLLEGVPQTTVIKCVDESPKCKGYKEQR